MQISKRLETLVKYIDKSDKLIDIGCDHALLDIYIIKEKILNNIIASDIHEGAYNQGKNNIRKYRVTKNVDIRLGNGLEVLTKEDKIDTILISGMGTNTILKILDNKYIKNINKLIIQSNNNHTMLRNEITKMGFIIKEEEYFKDNNKNYINEVFERGEKEYSKIELKYGPILMKNKEYLQFEINNINRIKKLIPKMKFRYRYKLYKEEKLLKKLIININ